MIERRFETALNAPPSEIWESVTGLAAINFELMPYLSMHSTDGTEHLQQLACDEGVRSLEVTLRLANIIQLGSTVIRIIELDEHRFVEESRQPGMDFWRHERVVGSNSGGGARLMDRLRFKPTRFPSLSKKTVERVFRHRHARLEARWNRHTERDR